MYKIILAVVISAIIGVATTASAQWGSPWGGNNRDNENYNARVDVRFSNYDRDLIHRYYKNSNRKQTPPGLAKKNKLPPGLQKQVLKNGKLPPGLRGRYLPYDLERELDYLPRNYVRIRVGEDIVLMDISTKIILDVIKDIAF